MFWVNVTCGVGPANGVYKPIGTKREDAYVYRNDNGFELSREKVDKIGWILGKAPEAYYGIPSKSLTPPQRGWKCYKGSKPAPTITYHKEKKVKQGKTSSDKASGKNQCNHRTKVYEEIIGTEEKYAQKLKTLIEVFLEPLLDEAYLPEELQTMLRLSRAIQEVAQHLLGYIQARIRQRPSLVVSSAFIKYAPQFTCYTPYCVRFMSANNKLRDLMRDDEKFRKRVNEISIANDNESLDSLLIRPVQRITKYHLFFRDLLASLDSTHPHRQALQTALVTVKEIAQKVNKDLYSAEKSAGKLLEIYQIMNGSCEDLVKPGRLFQMELLVKFKHKHSSDEMKQVFMYVFSDLIVLAKSAPTLRNKQQQKMVLCFYHRNVTLENVSEDAWEFYLKNITNIKDNTCVDRYILRCSAQDKFDSLYKLLEHLKNKQRQRTITLKRFRGTSRAKNASMARGASLEAVANRFRRNESADANSGSASTLPAPESKPRAWARRSMGGNERLALHRPALERSATSPRRWTANSKITAESESTTEETTSASTKPTRRKWASLRRGELRSRKSKFTGTLDAQAMKDLKAMSLREEESLRKEALKQDAAAAKAPAPRQYTEKELAKMSKHRRGIYKEIRQTEQEYMQSLKMMLNTYKKPLLQKKIISDEESRIIFSNVEGLLSTSQLLLQLLTGMDKEGVKMSKKLVDAFKMIVPTFKGYSVYCKDYQAANETLNDKMKNVSVFRKYVHAEQQKTKKGGQLILLQDLIIKPVQRICKYPLFFKAILDNTEDSHLMKKEFHSLLMQIEVQYYCLVTGFFLREIDIHASVFSKSPIWLMRGLKSTERDPKSSVCSIQSKARKMTC